MTRILGNKLLVLIITRKEPDAKGRPSDFSDEREQGAEDHSDADSRHVVFQKGAHGREDLAVDQQLERGSAIHRSTGGKSCF